MDEPPAAARARPGYALADMLVHEVVDWPRAAEAAPAATEAPPDAAILAAAVLPDSAFRSSVERAWTEFGVRGAGARIAIIDSGVRPTHAALRACVRGYHNYAHDGCPLDVDVDHGTHVCGIAAGAFGIGVAPDSEVHVFKVFGRGEDCRNASILRALEDIRDHEHGRFDVINMSLGSPVQDSNVRLVLLELCAAGVVCVAASGNDGDHMRPGAPRFGTTGFPAAYHSTICVGATDDKAHRTAFSSTGPLVQIMAPGSEILSAWPASDLALARCSGTSMASPFIAGVVALMCSLSARLGRRRPGLDQALYCLAASACDIESPGHDDFTGFGAVDPCGALRIWEEISRNAA